MASKGMSTAGMKLGYVMGAATAIPTTGTVVYIPEVKSVPNLNPTPQGIDITPLDEEDNVLYTDGLKDLGGVLEFGANLTDALITAWNTTLPSAISSATTGQVCWFCVEHKGITNAVWFIGEPRELGLNEASVNAALETTLYIAPKSAPKFGAKIS